MITIYSDVHYKYQWINQGMKLPVLPKNDTL